MGVAAVEKDRKRAARRRAKVISADRFGATLETKRKLTQDPLWLMWKPGDGSKPLLPPGGIDAADEIIMVYKSRYRIRVHQSRYGPEFGMPSGQDNDGDISDALVTAYHRRYLPWVRRTDRHVLEATIDLLLDRDDTPRPVLEVIAEAIIDYMRGESHTKKT